MGLFLSALGLMMIFEGIPYFCTPSKIKIFAQKINDFNLKFNIDTDLLYDNRIQNANASINKTF